MNFLVDPFTNNFKKKFIETAENYDIKNVQIIFLQAAIFCESVYSNEILPEIDDEIWIFFFIKSVVFSMIWKYDKTKTWKIKNEFLNIVDKNNFVKTLKKVKKQIKKSKKAPSIWVYCNDEMDEIYRRTFERLFSRFRRIEYNDNIYFLTGPTACARLLSGEDLLQKWKCDFFLPYFFQIERESNNTVILISYTTILPYQELLKLEVQSKETLKVSHCTTEILLIPVEEKGSYELFVDIDINGIFNITLDPLHSFSKEQNSCIFPIPTKLNNYDPIFNAIGIDLGTTECCLAVIRRNGPDFVQMDLATHDRSMPSYIAYDEEKPKCGQIVVDRLKHKSKYSVYDVKRFIGKSFEDVVIDPLWPFKLLPAASEVLIDVETYNGKVTKRCTEITGDLLKHIKTAAESYQGTPLDVAVISIPSEFDEKQKEATKLAAKYAGFEMIHFIPEPVAAAFAYITEMKIPRFSTVLICDCGGGTVDICVARVFENKFTVLCFDGDGYLGGRDFDNLLFTHYSATLKHRYDVDVMQSYKKYVLKKKCQEIKHTLSTAVEDWLDISDFDNESEDVITVTRTEFEAMSNDLLLQIKNVVCRAVAKAHLQRNQISHVFQVGGGCRMPMIKEMLKEIFPTSIHQCSLQPDWAVAHGAALYSYYLKTSENKLSTNPTTTTSFFATILKKIRDS